MKEQVIQLPDNFEVKEIKDGKIILVEKEKKLTYEDIVRSLFSKDYFFIGGRGEILKDIYRLNNKATDLTNCTSRKQAEKLLTINKLMNVAKYLNGDWQPDWTLVHERVWYIYINNKDKIEVSYSNCNCGDIYLRTEKLAKQAIDILGEETIRLALCTDY